MLMFNIPNHSSIAKAYQGLDKAGRMHASDYYNRIIDVTEELIRFKR